MTGRFVVNLSDQVTSLNLAHRLKELNLKQDSLFYYRAWENPLARVLSESCLNEKSWQLFFHEGEYSKSCDWEMSAYSLAELREMLPPWFECGKRSISDWVCIFMRETLSGDCTFSHLEILEIEARAKMLIHFIEANLVTEEWRKLWLEK